MAQGIGKPKMEEYRGFLKAPGRSLVPPLSVGTAYLDGEH